MISGKEALKFLEIETDFSSDEDIDKDLFNLVGNIDCRTIKRVLKALGILKKYVVITLNNADGIYWIDIFDKENYEKRNSGKYAEGISIDINKEDFDTLKS